MAWPFSKPEIRTYFSVIEVVDPMLLFMDDAPGRQSETLAEAIKKLRANPVWIRELKFEVVPGNYADRTCKLRLVKEKNSPYAYGYFRPIIELSERRVGEVLFEKREDAKKRIQKEAERVIQSHVDEIQRVFQGVHEQRADLTAVLTPRPFLHPSLRMMLAEQFAEQLGKREGVSQFCLDIQGRVTRELETLEGYKRLGNGFQPYLDEHFRKAAAALTTGEWEPTPEGLALVEETVVADTDFNRLSSWLASTSAERRNEVKTSSGEFAAVLSASHREERLEVLRALACVLAEVDNREIAKRLFPEKPKAV